MTFALRLLLIIGLLTASSAPAGATSKTLVAAIGDAAPGGGVFTGPGFTGWPTAAGDGWIAFRSQVTGGSVTETIVVAHMNEPMSQATVATLGEPAPSAGVFGTCTGKLKEFIGQPVVNANGDVAFLALIQPPADTGGTTDTSAPQPAGIFVFRGGTLVPIACSGQSAAGGILDLVAVLDVASDPSDVADRSPAMNAGGDVAFLTGYVDAQGARSGGAIVIAPAAGGYVERVRLGGPFGAGTFEMLGPPALNGAGLVAFHGSATDPSDTDGHVEGIFTADGSGVQVVVGDGLQVAPVGCPAPPTDADFTGQLLTEFEDAVALNDRGDVAFLAGPLSANVASDTPGVLVASGGVVTLIGYPGERIDNDPVTGVALGPIAGSALAPPSLAPDGSVAFFVAMNGGNKEALLRWDGHCVAPVLHTGPTGGDAAPAGAGSTYAGTESPPAVDAVGGLVFLARMVGGQSSEAVVYEGADATAKAIFLGDAAPQQNAGFYGGRPFTSPHLNDAGDIVFRAFVARGPSSIGIYRLSNGTLAPVVRAGDAAPVASGPPFLDFPGEPSVNAGGDVVFTAQLATQGRGIYVVDGTGIHALVLRGDAAPGDPGATFNSFGPNPQINDDGGVAFSGTTLANVNGANVRESGIFLKDTTGIHVLVSTAATSPAGLPFLRLPDPALTNVPSIVFRAPLGTVADQSSGIFVADTSGVSTLALQQQDLGDGNVIEEFSSNPAVNAGGLMAFLAVRSESGTGTSLGPAVFERNAAGALDVLAANNGPGPAGGTFKSFGGPVMGGTGHVLFRATFNASSGGTSGLYLQDDAGLRPYVLRGERTSLEGRLSAFRGVPSLNSNDEVAFSADVGGGNARSGLFLASPTTLDVRQLGIHLSGGKHRDRLALRALFTLGRVSDGVQPGNEAVVLSLADTAGPLWSVTVAAHRLTGHGGSWAVVPSRKGDLGRTLRVLRVVVGKHRKVGLSFVSAPIDLTQGGTRPLKPPFTLSVELGDDEGSVRIPCALGRRGGHCRS
ncbi:MAG TPA: choice-of-anchor tandem repeat NxxGxxAF-containing protein [Candidatus Binatia bacterium]|nr:choice-of-anchor tandem repeat NxxGxxAF-containing protein [Candidatus Binatia bacterium]